MAAPTTSPRQQNAPQQAASSRESIPQAPTPATFAARAEEYLLSKGWNRASVDDTGKSTWDDPLGSMAAPQSLPSHEAKVPGGGVTVVSQMVGPPIPWTYSTEEAYALQKNRDKHPAKPQVMQKLVG